MRTRRCPPRWHPHPLQKKIKSVLRNLSNIEWRRNALLCLRPDSWQDDWCLQHLVLQLRSWHGHKNGNMDTVCSITIWYQLEMVIKTIWYPLHSGNVNLHLTFGIQIPFSILSLMQNSRISWTLIATGLWLLRCTQLKNFDWMLLVNLDARCVCSADMWLMALYQIQIFTISLGLLLSHHVSYLTKNQWVLQ